ncbi:MAG TPA: hypothetical protein VLV83_04290 [Acidobacteriota bacterium]|nr:hypothetical protein [Acidobacteriota bacterium]
MSFRLILTSALLMLSGAIMLAQSEEFIPHVVDGQEIGDTGRGFRTEIFVINTGDEPVSVTVSLTSDEGEPMERFSDISGPPGGDVSVRTLDLPPRGSASLTTLRGPFVQLGWARVAPSQSVHVLANIRYEVIQTNEAIASAAVQSGPVAHSLTSIGQIGGEAGSTGLAILNTNEQETTVTVTLRLRTGEIVAETEVPLGPRGKVVQFLNESTFFPDQTEFRGVVDLSSDQPISIVAILVEELSWTTFPPTNR